MTIVVRTDAVFFSSLAVKLRCRRAGDRHAFNGSVSVIMTSHSTFTCLAVTGVYCVARTLYTDSFVYVSPRWFYWVAVGAKLIAREYNLPFRYDFAIK